jgi:hypothetical protein
MGLGGGFALRFVDDSPLEGSGFEPSVPLAWFSGRRRAEVDQGGLNRIDV